MRRRVITNEEKAVIKLTNILADLRLNLEDVGYHLAFTSDLMYNRLQVIYETATAEKEKRNDNNTRK
jgi:hypothetical protein